MLIDDIVTEIMQNVKEQEEQKKLTLDCVRKIPQSRVNSALSWALSSMATSLSTDLTHPYHHSQHSVFNTFVSTIIIEFVADGIWNFLKCVI